MEFEYGKLEVFAPKTHHSAVRDAHPYEEPVLDVVPLWSVPGL